ncbi:MAG TPA: NADH-ubiquinone oxidoreductase-F iron-sulfur binding region domain-containing protein [Candidatus Eremiobacteraeota bacterium]|nr:MAG: NAD-reducing hydrogenase HoxS subunit alpha [bacterium ADurb.Bin363]HPZ08622.1 NADH-ubiquinone oxidoreductase-F iron-sulfur binding region domain-containing protein [Candidatus Eremiobacteraeota bacterium]
MIQKKGPVVLIDIDVDEVFKKALSMSRVDILDEIKKSGLKGRGGAGFPTETKWNLAGTASDDKKYVVCNADEGEPGTFKDRVLLSDYTDDLLAGMTIAGYVIGSTQGIIYLRCEYIYLYKHINNKIEERRKKNLLGKNILGKDGFNFDIYIQPGAGAYVCGEETALIESLEGHRGEPRNRPPYPTVVGYLGKPTIINNVETFITAMRIIDKGAEWFTKYGTDKSTGTKLFSISGDCRAPGIYELPMGITVKELLATVGGEDAKAVQVGGASGSCITRNEFNLTLAYEDISTGGSIIIFGEKRNMLDIAINFMEFFVEESCGQCTPCRYGTETLLEGLYMLKNKKCSIKYLKELLQLGETMQTASKCGLGQSAPNAFISILKNFKHEILCS